MPRAERIEKMGSKKTTRAYVSENLKSLASTLIYIRGTKKEGKVYGNIDCEGLEKAIKSLPRKDRENIEKFWGLTGGINHSKKIADSVKKDDAFIRQSSQAIISLRNLFRLDYMSMFDNEVKKMLEFIIKKINKKGMPISDLEAIKYLLIFLVVLHNGPKMSFELDPMAVDNDITTELTFDEYSIIQGIAKVFEDIPDESINIRLIHDMLDMMDLRDVLAIKKSFCIAIPTEEIPKELRKVEIEPMYTLDQIRKFKERAFPYGNWEVATGLILGKRETIQLEEFMKFFDAFRKDWSKVTYFKTGQRKLQTLHELRTLEVYNIGGFEFTDIYEVMFLYVERNIIAP